MPCNPQDASHCQVTDCSFFLEKNCSKLDDILDKKRLPPSFPLLVKKQDIRKLVVDERSAIHLCKQPQHIRRNTLPLPLCWQPLLLPATTPKLNSKTHFAAVVLLKTNKVNRLALEYRVGETKKIRHVEVGREGGGTWHDFVCSERSRGGGEPTADRDGI